MNLADAHNHLQDEDLAPHWDEIAAAVEAAGIRAMVVNGTSPADWPAVTALAGRFPWVRASYGVHPWDVPLDPAAPREAWLADLRERLRAEPRAAVGEIGIDRWILERAAPGDPRVPPGGAAALPVQEAAFLDQLGLAADLGRPATVHCLDAWGRLQELFSGPGRRPDRLLLHAYGGPPEMVPGFVARGAWFSFNGAFLHPQYARARAAFAVVPLDRLLVETDAPAMPLPEGAETHRLPAGGGGQRLNHPANLGAVLAGLAALRGVPVAELAARLEANFLALFGP